MSGIWDRVVNRGERNNPVGSASLHAVIYFATRGMFTICLRAA